MTDETGLPSAADLDAVNAELAAGKAEFAAKAAHDKTLLELTSTAAKPDLTPGPDTDAAIAYVEAKGYTHEKAIDIVKENGVDTILAAKAHEQRPQEGQLNSVIEEALNAGAAHLVNDSGSIVSRHGEVFNPDIHAQLPTGDPKTDSTGRFIAKENDYAGPRGNPHFPQ